MKNRRKLRSLLSWILSLAMLVGTLGGDRIPVLAGDDVPVPAAEALDGDGENTFSCSVNWHDSVSVNQENAQKLLSTLLCINGEGIILEYGYEGTGQIGINVNPGTEYDLSDINITFYDGDNKPITDFEITESIQYAEICSDIAPDINKAEYTFDVVGADATMFSALSFTFYNTIEWNLGIKEEEIGDGVGFVKDGVIVDNIDFTDVKYGEKLKTAISDFPEVKNGDKEVLFWLDLRGLEWEPESWEITLDTTISDNIVVCPLWGDAPEPPVHTHRYHASTSGNVTGQVEWTWSDNYDEAEVTLYCISENCPSENHAKVPVSANITSEVETISGDNLCYCIRTVYTATAEYEGNEYTDTKESLKEVEHIYHESTSENIPGQVEWTWSGNDDDGYTAKVDLYCISENCMAADHGKVTVSADVTSTVKTVSVDNADSRICTVYTATAEYDGNEYTNTKQTLKDEVHYYHESTSGNIPGQVSWNWIGSDDDGYTAKVDLYCISENCMDSDRGKVTVSADVTVSGDSATCSKNGIIVWTARAEYDGNVYTDVKQSEVAPTGHSYKLKVEWNEDHKTAKKADLICSKCDDKEEGHTVSVNVTELTYELVTDEKTGQTVSNQAIYKAGTEDEIRSDVWYAVRWTLESVEWTASYADDATTAKAVFKLKVDTPSVNRVSVSADKIEIVTGDEVQKTFKATLDYMGGHFEDTKTVYSHTAHKWTVSFNWTSVSTNKAETKVSAEATCSVGGEKVALTPELTDKTVGSKIEYLAKATDPSGKVWTSKKNIDTKSGEIKDGPAGTPFVEGGDIVIIGLEETYPYTGSKIKPAVTVMDGDIVLAQSTDYTVSYTGKNKIGEINNVEVKGKGNYAGKSATAQFKIVDPRDDVDKDKLADKVSKVSVNNKKFTYNGKAQYPSEVTVTLKDKSTIVYKVEEDGSFTTESEKEVGLSFSNNINKGTATVAAIGSDGKVKKASYTIAAAEIGSAEFDISAVDWAVKAATPEIKATIKLGDEDVELVAGQDYKVSFKAKEAGENKGTAKISGKGNFKGKHADVTYTVTPMEITESNIVVKAIAGKKAKDVKVIVNDAFGNALNKKFYTVEIQNAEGTALNKGDALTEEIKVVVKGANAAVTTGEDGVTVDVKPAADIAKVKGAFKVDKNFFKTYTGEPITLDADDFVSGKINVGTLEHGRDFNIVAYKNNIKKGTMTVTVQGDGEYSGTKTFKVKIKAKPLDKLAPEN